MIFLKPNRRAGQASQLPQSIFQSFILVGALSMIFSSASIAADYSFKVKHHHFKGSCTGDLIINDSGIRYQTPHAKDQRQWTFKDIQEVQFLSETKLNLLAYEDSRQRLGGDKIFKFELQGEKLPSDAIVWVTSKFLKPISNRLNAENLQGQYEISVKHLHRISGCQGRLVFTDGGISFVSEKPGESRQWRFSDLQSIASSGRYELRLGTYEHGPLQYGDTKEFRFRLKEPLRDEVYRAAWARIYHIPVWRAERSGK